MTSAEKTPVIEGRPPADGRGPGTALREAMLEAIGELSDEERARLGSAEQPADVAQTWRDLIAERAAREREAVVRSELTREFQTRSESERQRPTSGLRGSAPASAPGSVAEWTEFIRSSGEESQRQRRRSQFADWLSQHPEA